jgi:hypothetical protein
VFQNNTATPPESYQRNELHCAIAAGKFENIENLLEKGVNPNDKDDFGNSSLHYLMNARGSIEYIKLLLSKGAKINEINDMGLTPLDQAMEISSISNRRASVGGTDEKTQEDPEKLQEFLRTNGALTRVEIQQQKDLEEEKQLSLITKAISAICCLKNNKTHHEQQSH